MDNFIHLHSHMWNSLMDGLNSPDEMVARAAYLGQPAMAMTDHGTLAGHRDFQIACDKHGVKPILGVEAYFSPTDRFDRSSAKDKTVQAYNHLIVLAKNKKGYDNLNKMQEIAWREGYYYKPRIDKELLDQYGDGLVILSGCLNGVLAKSIERGETTKAEEWMQFFTGRFGDDFYIELQGDNPLNINQGLIHLAKQFKVKTVATCDCHFASPEDRAAEEVMLVLSTSPKREKDQDYAATSDSDNVFERLNRMYPDRPISFENLDLYVMDRETVRQKFLDQGIDSEQLYDSTLEIADKIGSYNFHKGLELLPKPRANPDKRLRELVFEGLKERGLDGKQEYLDRVEEELGILADKGFSTYMLLVDDVIKFCRKKKIRVGPGRGSAAGSLVCYALGITGIDPLEFDLLFFRFINPERSDFPDIDMDIEKRRRKEVIAYLQKKFKHVAGISTFGTFADKGVFRDVARVFNVPLGEVNKVMKQVGSFEDFESGENAADFRQKYPEVLDFGRKLRGRIRSVGIHAAGIVVSKEPIEKYAPVETRKDPDPNATERMPVVAYDMDAVADVGLIKLDLLGLKALSILDDTLASIKSRHNVEIDLDRLDRNDRAVYADLSAGHTRGVFQVEQSAYTTLLKDMRVDSFEDLAASNALVRPGAKNTVGDVYIARKHGEQDIAYIHDIMEPFTRNTYGVIIYQEQVMLACHHLGGMSMATADKVRKIIGKKKDVSEFEQFKQEFVDGASQHISRGQAEALWHMFEAHAGYSFNRSHAVAYSLITYWMAWLKHYYPLEFMTALLANENDKDSLTMYYIEAKRLGLRVLLPHVNKSKETFSIENDAIRVGLGNIKYLSEKTAKPIMNKAPFDSYSQLLEISQTKGSGIGARAIQSLNKVGGAVFEDNKLTGDEVYNYYEYMGIPRFRHYDFPEQTRRSLTPLDEFDETSAMIVQAMVTKIKRGKGWALVDFIDETGGASAFHNEDTQIEVGQLYFMLIANNRIARYVLAEDVFEAVGTMPKDSFVKYLVDNTWTTEDWYYVVKFDKRKTRAGKWMGTLVVANHERDIRSVLVFPDKFNQAWAAGEGTVIQASFGRLDDGGLVLRDISN